VSLRTIATDDRAGLPESSFRFNPLQHVRWVYTRFVQGLFFYCPRGQYHWEPEMDDSEIYVTDENPVDADSANGRPIVTFTRAPVQFYSLGFDDMVRYNMRTGTKMKSVLIPGTMSINVCSKNDLESENLAFAIAEHLWLLRDMLQKEGGFFDIGRNIQIGSPSPPGKIIQNDSAKEWFCTTILSPYHFQRTSQLSPLGQQVARGFEASLTPRMGQIPDNSPVTGSGVVDQTPSYDGLPRVPHPLNPTRQVVVRQVRPYSPLLRAPSIGATVLPIQGSSVEQSEPHVGIKTTVKV
jgi:hypothetical protein